MRDSIVQGTRVPGPPDRPDGGDAVVHWRRDWEESVAAAGSDPRLTERRRDYGSYLFVALDLFLALIGQIILSIPLIVLAVLLFIATGHHLGTSAGQRELSSWLTSSPLTVASLVVTDGTILLVLWYRLSRLRLHWSIFGLGTPLRRNLGRNILLGLGLGVGALILSAVLGSVMQKLGLDQSAQDKVLIAPLHHAPLIVVLAMVCAGTFVAPVVEELFFRGYVFRAIAVRKGVPIAYIVSAGTFAFFHLLPTLFPVLFVIGLVLCFAYHRSGNLVTDITAHAFNNGVAFALALLPLPHHM